MRAHIGRSANLLHISKSQTMAVRFVLSIVGLFARCTPTNAAREGRGYLQTMPDCKKEKPPLGGLKGGLEEQPTIKKHPAGVFFMPLRNPLCRRRRVGMPNRQAAGQKVFPVQYHYQDLQQRGHRPNRIQRNDTSS